MSFVVTMVVAAAGWGLGWLVRDAQAKRVLTEMAVFQQREIAVYRDERMRLYQRLEELEPLPVFAPKDWTTTPDPPEAA